MPPQPPATITSTEQHLPNDLSCLYKEPHSRPGQRLRRCRNKGLSCPYESTSIHTGQQTDIGKIANRGAVSLSGDAINGNPGSGLHNPNAILISQKYGNDCKWKQWNVNNCTAIPTVS